MSHWINYSTDLFNNTTSLSNKTNDCLHEWVIWITANQFIQQNDLGKKFHCFVYLRYAKPSVGLTLFGTVALEKLLIYCTLTCSSVLFFTVCFLQAEGKTQGQIYYTEETVSYRKSTKAPAYLLSCTWKNCEYVNYETCSVGFVSHRLPQNQRQGLTVSTNAMCENDTG